MFFSEDSISLRDEKIQPPFGSEAAVSLDYLAQAGYDIVLDPKTNNHRTGQYMRLSFEGGVINSARKAAAARKSYLRIRESEPYRHLFLMSDNIGKLVASVWIAPRYDEPDLETTVPTRAIARAALYEDDASLGAHFLRVAHAHAYRYLPDVKEGIMMEKVTSPTLLSACAAIGYLAWSEDFDALDTRAGILGVDMVVSSGPLQELVRRNIVDTQLPPS